MTPLLMKPIPRPIAKDHAGQFCAARAERIAVQHHGATGEQGVVGEYFVRVDQHAEAADENDRGGPAAIVAEQFASGKTDKQQGQRGVEAGCQARAVMQRQDRCKCLGEQGGSPVIQRRFVQIGFARECRHDPVVALDDVIDQSEAVGFVRLPRIVPDESGEHPRCTQQKQETRFDRRDLGFFQLGVISVHLVFLFDDFECWSRCRFALRMLRVEEAKLTFCILT